MKVVRELPMCTSWDRGNSYCEDPKPMCPLYYETSEKPYGFRIVALEKTLQSPFTARRSNKPIIKEINPEYSLQGLMLKLKLQHFGHLMQRAPSLEKTLMLGKIEGRRRREQQRRRWLDGIIDSMDISLSKIQEIVKDRDA